MNIQDIVLIIPNFNQLTYLRNLINWWKWYYPNNPILIIDNGSTYPPLLNFYQSFFMEGISKTICKENNFIGNLSDEINRLNPEYYVISDPDIMPHPSTPPNFLEIFKVLIDSGFHHAGFDLITDDIPKWNKKAGWIQGDEQALHNKQISIEFAGESYTGFRAPIDTTFALYSRDNGGWQAPMPPINWDNSVRMFKVFHLAWYQNPEYLNDEMKHYYSTCLKRDDSLPSAGRNHYAP